MIKRIKQYFCRHNFMYRYRYKGNMIDLKRCKKCGYEKYLGKQEFDIINEEFGLKEPKIKPRWEKEGWWVMDNKKKRNIDMKGMPDDIFKIISGDPEIIEKYYNMKFIKEE